MKLFLLFSLIRNTEKKMREKIICVLSILLKYVWKLIRWIQHWISFLFFLYIPFGSINYVCADWNEYIYKKRTKAAMTLFKYHARKFDSFVIQRRNKKGENKSHFPIHWTNIYLWDLQPKWAVWFYFNWIFILFI